MNLKDQNYAVIEAALEKELEGMKEPDANTIALIALEVIEDFTVRHSDMTLQEVIG